MLPEMLPPELKRFAHLSHIKKRTPTEYSAECPVCHSYGHEWKSRSDMPDRFRMWSGANARGWCRICGHFEWADSDISSWNPAQHRAAKKEKERLAKQQIDKQTAKLESLKKDAYWKGWHDCMSEKERGIWRREGIPDSAQDWFELGFVKEKKFYYQSELRQSEALSIPYKHKTGIVNIQFKLLCKDANEVGKYRFTSGLPASMFVTEPEKDLKGTGIIVEGAKKAIITWLHMGHMVDMILGVPSKYLTRMMADTISQLDVVYLALDPDANNDAKDEEDLTSSQKAALMIGEQARYASLPMKIDDLLAQNIADADSIMEILKQGRRVRI